MHPKKIGFMRRKSKEILCWTLDTDASVKLDIFRYFTNFIMEIFNLRILRTDLESLNILQSYSYKKAAQ